jgi:ribose 1,5-bisphosphate isomerase
MDKNIKVIVRDIKSLKIQGATNIAKAAITALNYLLVNGKYQDLNQLKKNTLLAAKDLAYARPTGLYAQSLYYYLKNSSKFLTDKNSLVDNKQILFAQLSWFENLINQNEKNIINYGASVLRPYNHILTHCHSSTVVKILITLNKKNNKLHVFADETRPLLQGRITAKNLSQAGVVITHIPDSASGFLISPWSGKDLMMNAIVVGADAIRVDGSIINKIGTYDIAASAYLNKIPFFVATSLLKYDFLKNVKIEKRSDKEVWATKPKNVRVLNFAFDLVPAQLITGLITEFGLIKPSKVKKVIKEKYLWLK